MRKFTLLLLMGFLCVAAFGQQHYFTDAGENKIIPTTGLRVITPQQYRASSLNVRDMKNFLWSLPSEQDVVNRNQAPIMELLMPDGTMAQFRVWESSIMEPALAAKFPEMRTFAGQGITDPYATVRFDYNPYFGFHAQVLSLVSGTYYIDPYARGDVNNYISYYKRDNSRYAPFVCETQDDILPRQENIQAGPCRGTQLFTYRLALACTGEYAVAVCAPSAPTVPATAAAMLTTVNRVTGVYETEVSLRMVLVANNNLLIYLDGTTDPYTNNNGATMLGQNQTTVDNIIGSANYDIGHVVSTGGGGVANLRVPCVAGSKARGVTGLPFPVGDNFDIDYVAHEMGHQWGGNHTFNSNLSNCGGGNRNASTAYEVGSGTTIQGYAGICGADDTQPHSDPYFHTISYDEISNNIETGNSSTCKVATATGNTLPVITAMNNNGVNIPTLTPFTLTGAATDANGDAITYNWEEWDLGPTTVWNGGNTTTTAPLFKSRIPKTSGSRTFPDIAVILAGFPANPAATMGGLKGETMASVARAMKFRLTVRDNRAGGGGVVSGGEGCQAGFTGTFQVNVTSSGPFLVTVPNGGESYVGGSTQTITWDPALTASAPISVANVKISLSTDGGLTYPTVITASTPNDGSEALPIPSVTTTTARVKIEAVGNIFFDISNANFTITPPPIGFSFNAPSPAVATCPAPNFMDITLGTISNGGFSNQITLSATGNPGGTTVSFIADNTPSPGQSRTVRLTGTNTLAPGSYVVTVNGTATGSPNQTVNLTYTINPGAGPVITTQPVNQTVCVGSTATFSVVSTGTYQWQLSTDAGGNWTNIGGATATSYTTPAATVAMNGYQYRVIVTGLCGSTTSSAATLTVNTPPSITAQPQSLSVCSGSAVSFSVTATGSGLTYQWQLSTDGGNTYNPIGGATAATFNIAAVTAAMTNNRYRVIVTGACPPPVTSSAAILTVATSITVTTNPTDVTLCEGTNTSFTVAGSGSGLTYQWQVSTDGGNTWNNVNNGGVYTGATSPTLVITGVLPSMNTYKYRAIISNGTCTPGTSSAATLTVNTFPNVTTQPVNVTICAGGNATFGVTATTGVGTLSYQWQLSTDGGTTWTNISGATTNSFAQTNIPVGQNGYRFRVVVTAGCGSVNSNAAILTVNPLPSFVLNNLPTTVCLSDPAFTLSASVTGGTWTGTGVAGTTFTPGTAGLGSKTVTYTVTTLGCTTAVSSTVQVDECAERHRLLDDPFAVFIYPNPNNGLFNFRMNTDLYSKLVVKIFASNGSLIKSQVITGIGFGSVIPMDISRSPRGTYHLYLYNDEHGPIHRGASIIVSGR